jgi:hypothetical protein
VILGDVVYFSDLGSRSSEGLNLRSGQVVFSFPDGAFNPAVGDNEAVYMVGYSTIYQMLPKRSRGTVALASHRRAAKPRAARRRAAKTRHHAGRNRRK